MFDWFRSKRSLSLQTPDDDPEARRLRLAQQRGDYQSVAAFFGKLTDPDAREFYVRELTQWPGRPPFFDNWVNAMPDCAEAWLLRAAHGIQWAWEARSGGRATQVAEEAWPMFFSRLEQAWSDLQRAIELNSRDSIPYAEQINCAIGLELEKSVVMNSLEDARQRAPEAWEPHVRTLFYLCRKWHGSHEEMFDFAHTTSRAAGIGSGLHALVAVAHIERWLYAAAFDRDHDYANNYWYEPGVRSDVREAYRKSLGAREFKPTRAARWQRSFFAFALTKAEAFTDAMREFNQIGNRPVDFPWHFFGDPLAAYSQHRELARANA
jgi:hypothetical protein